MDFEYEVENEKFMLTKDVDYSNYKCRAFSRRRIEREKLDAILEVADQTFSRMDDPISSVVLISDPDVMFQLEELAREKIQAESAGESKKKKTKEEMKENEQVKEKLRNPFYRAPHLIAVLTAPYALTGPTSDMVRVMDKIYEKAHQLGLYTNWDPSAGALFKAPVMKEKMEEIGISADLQAIGFILLGYPLGEDERIISAGETHVFNI